MKSQVRVYLISVLVKVELESENSRLDHVRLFPFLQLYETCLCLSCSNFSNTVSFCSANAQLLFLIWHTAENVEADLLTGLNPSVCLKLSSSHL